MRKAIASSILHAAVLLSLAAATDAGAQTPAAEPAPSAGTPQVYRTTGSRVALGRSITVAVDEEVTDVVVVIGGSLRIDGRVRDGVVVVGGNVDLGPRSDVRGDIFLIGGRLAREAGAQFRGQVSDISFGERGSWGLPGLALPAVDFGDVGRWLLLLGAVLRISVLAVILGVVLIFARAPVARIGRAAGSQPARAFVVGLAGAILFVPALIMVSISLVVTLIGIPLLAVLVPVAVFGAFVALSLGFTSMACALGEWTEDRLGWRSNNAFVATAVGLMLIVAPTIVARAMAVASAAVSTAAFGLLVIGLVVEAAAWTTGLGATIMTGFGRWSSAPPPVPPVDPVRVLSVPS
ncbi:MAG: hypothetical protein ACT4QD_23225 [Acidobacteriota bacterium]